MEDWIDTPESGHVSRIRYEPDTQEVFVEFSDGSTYRYSGVPQNVYEELKDHPSKGRYINIVLRRRYQYQKV